MPGKPSGTISSPQLVTDTGTPGISHNDQIDFNVDVENVDDWKIDVFGWDSPGERESKNAETIISYYGGATVHHGDGTSETVTLSSQAWPSGVGYMRAVLVGYNPSNGHRITLATLDFDVAA